MDFDHCMNAPGPRSSRPSCPTARPADLDVQPMAGFRAMGRGCLLNRRLLTLVLIKYDQI